MERSDETQWLNGNSNVPLEQYAKYGSARASASHETLHGIPEKPISIFSIQQQEMYVAQGSARPSASREALLCSIAKETNAK